MLHNIKFDDDDDEDDEDDVDDIDADYYYDYWY
jgi:hypothetical protein